MSKGGGSLGGAGCTAYIFTPDPENPTFTVDITDLHEASRLIRLLEELEDQDDIQEVYVNFLLPEQAQEGV